MAEETKPTEVKPVAKAPSNAELKTQLEAEQKKIKEQLARIEALESKSSDYGPGKSGKKKFKMPAFPPEWKMTTLKTINAKGKTVYYPGRVYELTFDEKEDVLARFSQRARFETFARTAQKPIDLDLSQSGGNIF